ncbi:hypothetical protein ASG21_18160 [Chryseobacterium sp. Leaf394]|nr:hypothetical protein ASG21_18160 [Chryseobacterium sp. Leaf394]
MKQTKCNCILLQTGCFKQNADSGSYKQGCFKTNGDLRKSQALMFETNGVLTKLQTALFYIKKKISNFLKTTIEKTEINLRKTVDKMIVFSIN